MSCFIFCLDHKYYTKHRGAIPWPKHFRAGYRPTDAIESTVVTAPPSGQNFN